VLLRYNYRHVLTCRNHGSEKPEFFKKPNPVGFLGFIGFFEQAGKIGKIIQKLVLYLHQ